MQRLSRTSSLICVFVLLIAVTGQCASDVLATQLHNIVEGRDGVVIINEGESPVDFTELFKNQSSWIDPPVDVVIITSDALSPYFEPLANLKTGRGTYTEILTIETIEANDTLAAAGRDRAERIRNAIKYYHENKGTEFVILGGDVSIVPTRYIYNPDTSESYFPEPYHVAFKPTDHYYACLEGTWDGDNDNKFGEMNLNNEYNTDEIDWTAEVYVGRLPVTDAGSTQAVVNKIVEYELNPPVGSWYAKSVFAGAVSQYRDAAHDKPAVDEAELSEFIIDNYFNAMDVQRLYRHTPDYIPQSTYDELNSSSLSEALNEGSAIVNMAGHGDPASFVGYIGLSSYESYITRNQAQALTNGMSLPLVYIFSCSSGAFDIKELGGTAPMNLGNSLAEELVLNPNGGAIGVVSAARTSYYFENDKIFESLNHGQNRFFWREFMVNNQFQPGKTLYKSLEYYKTQFIDKYWNVDLNRDEELASKENYRPYEEKFRKNILTYNLLGDPEVRIYTRKPTCIDTGILPTTTFIGDTLILEPRSVEGEVVRGGRVLLNGSGYYITADIDEHGIACVPVPQDQSLVGMNMTLTISGQNIMRISVNVTFLKDTTPPSSLSISFSSSPHDFNKPLMIIATGHDIGSGLKYAYVIFTFDNGTIKNTRKMKIASITGDITSFIYQEEPGFPPGGIIHFYVAGFDASGHFIAIKSSEEIPFSLVLTSRILEDVMIYGAAIGIPAVALVIVAWMLVSRKKRRRGIVPVEKN
nr:C25 family cysteine peptidase [Candidatus Sigynarchaeota archaeon]